MCGSPYGATHSRLEVKQQRDFAASFVFAWFSQTEGRLVSGCFGSLKMWFEERETQAAELWRIIETCLGGLQILWRRCISEHHHRLAGFGQPGQVDR